MTKLVKLVPFLAILIVVVPAFAQRNHIVYRPYDPSGTAPALIDFTISQPFIPYSDSGLWVPAEIDITNNLDTPDSVEITLGDLTAYGHGVWSFVPDSSPTHFRKYFEIPAHAHTPDVVLHAFYHCPFPIKDTVQVGGGVYDPLPAGNTVGWGFENMYLYGQGSCADFDGIMTSHPKTVLDLPDTLFAAIGGWRPERNYYDMTDETPRYSVTPLSVSYAVVGEYPDSFEVHGPSRIVYDSILHFGFSFRGAPKHIVFDTIVATYSNCVWTKVERWPIVGNTIYAKTHLVRIEPDSAIIPFLGQTTQRMWIRNLTANHMEVYGLSDHDDYSSEYLGVFPQTISIEPFDSAYIKFYARDNPPNDLYSFHWHLDTVRYQLSLTDAPGMLTNPNDSNVLRSSVNVYCPEYFSYVPELKSGVHPAGIVFQNTDAPFRTVYGNDDIENYEFFQPYFDDPLFSIKIDGSMPRMVTPSTGDWMYATTNFAGNGKQDVITQLHWPRKRVRDGFRDTITIDVMEIGLNAQHTPPKLGVGKAQTTDMLMWPNPASNMVYLRYDGEPIEVEVTDPLGRTIKTQELTRANSAIDVRELSNGIYWIRFTSLGIVRQVLIER